jgi:nucleotide-binding universal stress UspA family protein
MTEQEKPLRVVVGIDFSDQSAAVARWTARWLPEDAELILAHALVVPELDRFLANQYPLPPSFLENAKLGADRRLKELSASVGYPRTWVEIREGRPSQVMAQVAAEFGADLVVVGKHGEGGSKRGYPGRTAEDLVRSSTVPVLVTGDDDPANPKRIAVALTFSSVTDHVVKWVARFASAFNADVMAIHVVGSAVLSHVLSMASVTQGKATMSEPEIEKVFSPERDQWTEKLVAVGIPAERVSSIVVFGDVADALLSAADEGHADMIIMGSHAGPVRRALLGSAASGVLRHAMLPVLVVREPESRD